MQILRLIGYVWGGLCAFAGSFWALQGAGIIMWPESSFMLADPKWIQIGSVVALSGLLTVLLARGTRGSGQ